MSNRLIALFIILFVIFSGCDGGLTVPYVNLTVQSTTVSDEDLKQIESDGSGLFRYSVPGTVSVEGKPDQETARIVMRQKRNFRFQIACQARSFLTFDKWVADPAENVQISNPTSASTLILLKGDCVVTATFSRHRFAVAFAAGNALTEPVSLNDGHLNSLYESLRIMKEKGYDLNRYVYPTFDERGILTANPDYPTYQSLLDFMSGAGEYSESGLDRNGDGMINYYADNLTPDRLNRFFFGEYDEATAMYRGLYAGILFFGDFLSSAPDGNHLLFEGRADGGAAGSFDLIGWSAGGGLNAVVDSGPGEETDIGKAVYTVSGDGVAVCQVICPSVVIRVAAVKVSADDVIESDQVGRVRLRESAVEETAVSSVGINGTLTEITVAENETILVSITAESTERFVGWAYDEGSMVLIQAGDAAELMPVFSDYLYQTAQRTVKAVFVKNGG